MDERAARQAELLAQVGARLAPGEALREACWFTRVPGRRSAGEVFRAEVNPLRVAEGLAWDAAGVTASTGPGIEWYQAARNGVLGGPPGSLGVELDEQLPEPRVAQVLALTNRRVLVLRRQGVRPTVTEPAPGGGLRDRLSAAARQVRAAWQGPSPADRDAPLEVAWQVGLEQLARIDALPGGTIGRLALLFADGSWIVLGPPDAATALRMAASRAG
ncbi:hypothetical protein C7C45_32060 [Micromonospora arborensis]|uniref:Uncharacterized protein n=1 Tax=Micromonospora arborensis TaxID=2116518 RepID=A0A318NDX7_9ACTN|nr:hypothetical protein [Micromonospora arborensis]PYC63341.1 hypothetical protein C7C45_32060 [Micromonospora arborensis]